MSENCENACRMRSHDCDFVYTNRSEQQKGVSPVCRILHFDTAPDRTRTGCTTSPIIYMLVSGLKRRGRYSGLQGFGSRLAASLRRGGKFTASLRNPSNTGRAFGRCM